MPSKQAQNWLFAALTAILVGYFCVWLPHEAAGLKIIGLELGEQAKFLPQVRSGQIRPGRSLFYLPPITVAILLLLITSRWPGARWQSWAARLLAVGISLLAFPALEALGTEAAEWLWRVLWIGLVALLFLLSPLLARLPDAIIWLAALLTALAGGLAPTWIFLEVRAAYSELLRQQLGLGLGFWLNIAGHFLIAIILLLAMRRPALSA